MHQFPHLQKENNSSNLADFLERSVETSYKKCLVQYQIPSELSATGFSLLAWVPMQKHENQSFLDSEGFQTPQSPNHRYQEEKCNSP